MKEFFRKNLVVSMLRNFKFNSIFVRMLAITFGVIFILCMINFLGIKVMTQQALNNEKSNSKFYVDYSYSYMNKLNIKLEEYMHLLEYDRNVIFLRILPKKSNYAQNYIEVTDVFNKLCLFRELMDEVTNVYIYFPNLDRIMTSQGEYETQTFFQFNYKGNYDDWKKLLTQKYVFTFNIWNFDTSPGQLSQLNLVKSFHEGQGVKSVIVANLHRNLVKVIFKDNDYASSRRIYITDENLQIFSCNTSEEIGKRLNVDTATLKKANQGSYYSSEFLISYRYLPEDHIYFIVMTPKDITFKNVNNLTFAAYIFLTIMLVVGLMLSVLLSQQFCLPIGQMLKDIERFATVSMGLPRSQNEYDCIKDNINIIYANNTKLETTIKESVPFVIDMILAKLILGGQEIENATILCSQYNIEFKNGYYVVAVMKCSNSYMNMPMKAVADLTAIIKKSISNDIPRVLKINDDEILAIAYFEKGEQINLASECFLQLSAILEETYEDVDFYFGLGRGVDNIYKINSSYHDAQKALDDRRVQDNDRVFSYNPANMCQKEIKIHIPVDFEERYRNAIYAGNLERSEDLIYKIMDSNFLRNVSFISYFKLCTWLLGIMERVLDSADEDITRKVSKELLINIHMVGDIVELNDRLSKNNRLLCTTFLSEKKSDTNFLKILKYVDTNFNTSINLDAVANNFGYNASYFSRLFKHTKGIGFSDYLAKKKIEYAKKLLVNQGKTIKEIAEESGYNSTGIFIKAFEKAEGISPGEYRKRKYGDVGNLADFV